MMIKKILHISHIDLDGYGCIAIIRKMFKDLYNTEVDYMTVDYGFEDDTNLAIMEKILNYDIIIFSDISFSERFARKLHTLRTNYGKSIMLLDHHESAITKLSHLEYNWMILDTSKCGTSLCYDYAEKMYLAHGRLDEIRPWKYFSDLVDDYDRWVHNDYTSTRLQFLWSSMDKVEFLSRFTADANMTFSSEEESIIKTSEDMLIDALDLMNSKIQYHTDIANRRFGVVPKTNFYSLAADRILKTHDIDYLVLVDGGSISFRSREVNVLPICESLGGGGHKLACGASVDPLTDIVESVKHREIIKYEFVRKFENCC